MPDFEPMIDEAGPGPQLADFDEEPEAKNITDFIEKVDDKKSKKLAAPGSKVEDIMSVINPRSSDENKFSPGRINLRMEQIGQGINMDEIKKRSELGSKSKFQESVMSSVNKSRKATVTEKAPPVENKEKEETKASTESKEAMMAEEPQPAQ